MSLCLFGPMKGKFMRYYGGFCYKYGAGKMFTLGLLSPIIINAVIQMANNRSIGASVLTGALAGFLGFLAGDITRGYINTSRILSKRGVGLTRGGKIVRAFQAAAYAVPVTLALTFNTVWDFDKKTEEPGNPENVSVPIEIVIDQENPNSQAPAPDA